MFFHNKGYYEDSKLKRATHWLLLSLFGKIIQNNVQTTHSYTTNGSKKKNHMQIFKYMDENEKTLQNL